MRVRSVAPLVLLALVVLVLSLAPPVDAPDEDLGTQKAPQAIVYGSEVSSWPGAVLTTESGTVGDDECTFHDSGNGAASADGTGQVTVIDTMSFEPATCTRTVVTATYSRDSAPEPLRKAVDAQLLVFPVSPTPLPAVGTLPGASTTTWSGSLAVTVKDPLNLTITQTVTGLTWTGTDTSVAGWAPYHADSWATWSGWSRYAGRYDFSGGGSTYAYADTAGYYRNDLFCPGRTNTTYSAHSVTYFRGEQGGGWRWSRSLHYSGGCSWMLHDTMTLVTP